MRLWCLWLHDTRGATAIEYAIIVGLISAGLSISLGTIGNNLNVVLTAVADGLGGAPPSPPPPPVPQAVKTGGP